MEITKESYFTEVLDIYTNNPALFTTRNEDNIRIATCQGSRGEETTILFDEKNRPFRISFTNPEQGKIVLDNKDGDINIREISTTKPTNS